MAAARKTISIVTPCFNEEAGIAECVAVVGDIFKKDLPDYDLEHIFCDNASTDRTVTTLKELARGNGSIKIISQFPHFGILKNTYNGVLQVPVMRSFCFSRRTSRIRQP